MISPASRGGEPVRQRWIFSLYLLALGAWVGAMLFFSAVVLPLLFTQLGPGEAGPIAALIFPYYYKVGLAAAVLVCACVAVFAMGPSMA